MVEVTNDLCSYGMVFLFQFDFKEAPEFTGEIDGDSCMHRTLFVEEALPALDWEYPLVPDVRMYVKTPAAFAAEADKILRFHVISW